MLILQVLLFMFCNESVFSLFLYCYEPSQSSKTIMNVFIEKRKFHAKSNALTLMLLEDAKILLNCQTKDTAMFAYYANM